MLLKIINANYRMYNIPLILQLAEDDIQLGIELLKRQIEKEKMSNLYLEKKFAIPIELGKQRIEVQVN